MKDPSQAKLFIVDSLINTMNLVKSFRLGSCCADFVAHDEPQNMCGRELLHAYDKALGKALWFQRYGGADHVLVASHFGTGKMLGTGGFRALTRMNRIAFESNHVHAFDDDFGDRVWIASTYVGFKCDSQPKQYDTAFIGTMDSHLGYKRPTFQLRRSICEWLQRNEDLVSVAHCGKGDQCPHLAQARLGFHVRGDTLGSNRLIDTLLSETVAVMTAADQYNIMPPMIPFEQMTVFVDGFKYQEKEFVDRVRDILDNGEYERVQKFNRDRRISTFLDWGHSHLAHLYMVAFQQHVLNNDQIDVQYDGEYDEVHGCTDQYLFCADEQKSVCRSGTRRYH